MTQIGKPPCDDAAIRSGEVAAPCSDAAKRGILLAAILGSSMAFIDGTVVNVALPAIQRDLHADAFQAQWVVESYALFLAALLLVGGSLGDHFGRRRIFAIGVALFAVASAGCAMSATVQQLIAARAVQGIGAAMLVPCSLKLIRQAYPDASERARWCASWMSAKRSAAAWTPWRKAPSA